MALHVLTWNLFHGRARVPARRHLLDAFAERLAAWPWDVALLQEVPPWWPAPLASRTGAAHRVVLTSRNALLPVRRALATRWPDLVKSNGGGSNAILVRGEWIAEHRVERLAWLPERRRLHAIRTASGLWIANLHAGGTRREARLAAATATAWAGDAPLVLGGDFNIRELALDGFECAGGNGVDHVYVRGLKAAGHTALPDRGELSDHEPVLVNLR